jgi:hypothetical protein
VNYIALQPAKMEARLRRTPLSESFWYCMEVDCAVQTHKQDRQVPEEGLISFRCISLETREKFVNAVKVSTETH